MIDKYNTEIFLVILCILISISILFIYIGITSVKTEYDIGEGLRKQCSPFFMEKERGEHRAYNKYVESSSYNFKNANILLVVCLLIISTYYLFYIPYCLKYPSVYKGILSNRQEISSTVLKIMHILSIITLLIISILIIVYTTKSYSQTCKHLPEHEKTMLRTQSRVIWSVFSIISILTIVYTPSPSIKNIAPFIIAYVVIAIILQILIELLIDFREKITHHYDTYKKTLCDDINLSKTNKPLKLELEKNMLKQDDEIIPCDIDSDNCDCGDYIDSYKYLMHIINNHNVTSISIPQQLKFMFKPTYLGGENILDLKRALIKMYYNFDELGKSDNNEHILEYLLNINFRKYLTKEVECAIGTGCSNTNEQQNKADKERYINLFKTHLINNTIFKKGDPLTNKLRISMMKERQSSVMKDAIFKYYNIFNTFFRIIIIILAYLIYHFLIFKNEPGKRIQVVAICMFIFIIIASIVNWFSRVASI